MNHPYWQRQTTDKPLFSDLIWSRPENRTQAGKLLIVGGNAYGFAAAAEAYAVAERSGIGTCRVVLPDSLRKTVGRVLTVGEYVPSTPSGSFAKQGLAELMAHAYWGDAVLLAGDFGHNSETAILLESFARAHDGPMIITQDAVDYFVNRPLEILARANSCVVLSFAQLQKLATSAKYTSAFTFDIDFLRLVDQLHDFTKLYGVHLIVKHLQNIFVASHGQVSSTKLEPDLKVWRVQTAAAASVWWLQNPSKPFEALTSSLIVHEDS